MFDWIKGFKKNNGTLWEESSKSAQIQYPAALYNIHSLQDFVSKYIGAYISQPILAKGKTEEEYGKAKARKDNLQRYLEECSYGDIRDKNFVKLFIKQLIVNVERDPGIFVEGYPRKYGVNPENIHLFLDLRQDLSPEHIFRILLHGYKKEHGARALGEIIEEYRFNTLRSIHGDAEEQLFFVLPQDIKKIYRQEPEHFSAISFEDTLDILVQILYERYKGHGVIDELLDMDRIDEVSIGVTGLPNAYFSQEMPRSYESICIRYKGNPIHFRFLSFGSFAELKRVVKGLVKYEQTGQFSQKEGKLLGYRKNGSRVSAARPPFAETWVAWVRNFFIKNVTFEQLVKGIYGKEEIKGWRKVVRRVRLLVKGRATTALCGGQGLGKTTALVALIAYIDGFLSLRIIESVFEMLVRLRYPYRDNVTMQSTPTSTEVDAYTFGLRTSGDVFIIAESREDNMIAQTITSGNRGGEFILFSFHPNRAELCPTEMADALLRMGTYTSVKEAVRAVLKTLKCCIQMSKDIEGNRYYALYEYTPRNIPMPEQYKSTEGFEEKTAAFMDTQKAYYERATEEQNYNTVPLVEFDQSRREYVIQNTVSDELYEHLWMKLQQEADRIELKKVFRPETYIRDILQEQDIAPTPEAIEAIIRGHDMDAYDNPKKAAEALYREINGQREVEQCTIPS